MTKTDIKRSLRNCSFDPNDPRFKLLKDCGKDYLFKRTVEELTSNSPNIVKCIQLLILVQCDT